MTALLIVADNLDGGLGATAKAHADYFTVHGWTVRLAAPDAARTIGQGRGVDLDVPDSVFEIRRIWSTSRNLRREIHAHRPDILHAHGMRSMWIALLAGHKPFVTKHTAGPMGDWSRLGAFVRAGFSRLAPMLSRGAFSVSPIGPGWQAVMPASPLLSAIDEQPVEAMAQTPLFLWIGRLDAPKRPADFVNALAAAARQRPCRGVMLGTGPQLEAVRRLVAESGAPIDVLGHCDDVRPWLAAAWAVCLFSDTESLGFAVQEAMWAGRVAVASPLAGTRWFAGDAALYAGNVSEACDALVRLCDREETIRLGRRAADHARSVVKPDAPFPVLEAAYRRVLAASR